VVWRIKLGVYLVQVKLDLITERENGAATYEASGNCRYVELVYIVCSGINNGWMVFLFVEG